tara:strand:+ start:547 stop:927 length:381 start_codon:yes stop_codon:yes gene_type:complete
MIKSPIKEHLTSETIAKLNALRNQKIEPLNFQILGQLFKDKLPDPLNKDVHTIRTKNYGPEYANTIADIRQMSKYELNQYLKEHRHIKGFKSDYFVNKKGKYKYKKDDYTQAQLYVYAYNRLISSK